MGIYQDRDSLSQVQILESSKFGLKTGTLLVLLLENSFLSRSAKYIHGTV